MSKKTVIHEDYMGFMESPKRYIYKRESEKDLIEKLNIRSNASFWTKNGGANRYKAIDPAFGYIIILPEDYDTWLHGKSFFYGWQIVLPKNAKEIHTIRNELRTVEKKEVASEIAFGTTIFAVVAMVVCIGFFNWIGAVAVFLTAFFNWFIGKLVARPEKIKEEPAEVTETPAPAPAQPAGRKPKTAEGK